MLESLDAKVIKLFSKIDLSSKKKKLQGRISYLNRSDKNTP